MFNYNFVIVLLLYFFAPRIQLSEGSIQKDNSSTWNVFEESNSYFTPNLGDISLVYKIYKQCSENNVTVCLKVKLLTGLDKVLRNSKEIKFYEGIKFVKDEDLTAEEDKILNPAPSEKDIEASLPRSLSEKEDTLNNMIFQRIISLLQSYTLQVKFPNSRDLSSSFEEARKKKNKGGGGYQILMIPVLLGGIIIPLALGGLATIVGKALIVSKLALVLASILGIKKLLGGGGKESQHEVVVSGGHGSSGWGRDFNLAYKAYAPKEHKL